MAYKMTYIVKLKHNTPRWKKWLINKLSWYQYNIAWKQPIWVVYDMKNKRISLPGGTNWNEASNKRDIMEDLRRDLVL